MVGNASGDDGEAVAGANPGAERDPVDAAQVAQAFEDLDQCGMQERTLVQGNELPGPAAMERRSAVDNPEVHAIAVAERRSRRGRRPDDGVGETTEVGELTGHDASLPIELCRAVRVLPLAAATR